MATSKVRIISNAFISLGKDGINYLDLENKRHRDASSLYDMLLPFVLSQSGWRFALKNRDLQRLNETPNNEELWKYVFLLPQDPDLLLLYSIYPNVSYAIYENKRLYANEEELKADYIYQVDEGKFPPAFEKLMTDTLTARLAMAVTQNVTIVNYWTSQALETLKVSQQIDSQQMHSYEIDKDDPITLAHST